MNGNDLKSAGPRASTASTTDEIELAARWDEINWRKVYGHVNRMKTRIAKAGKAGQTDKVRRLQRELTNSFDAKLAAVHRVTTNRGARTAGVDGVTWRTSAQKMQAAMSLTSKGYKARPLKRIYIDKKGKKGKKRPLSIPTMYDRAMQALYAMALSPIAEVRGDRHSFGFREGRSAQDASLRLFGCLSHRDCAKWVLEGDIKGCFDNISHEWLMENIPMDKAVLKEFLRAGFMHEGMRYDTDMGTPQGGIISPILANMALDGIDELLDRAYHCSPGGKHRPNHAITGRNKVNYVRYADDFVITAATEELALEIKGKVAEFLAERGLTLSEEKTVITHIDEGFDFLGWTFRKYDGKLLIRPSKESVKRFLRDCHETILRTGKTWTQEEIIRVMNPKIRGFASYHRHVCSGKTFNHIDKVLHGMLVRWAKRRHPKKGHKWRSKKYWTTRGSRSYIFGNKESIMFPMAWQHIVRHPMLDCSKNPYIDAEYFDRRKEYIKKRFENSFRPAAPNNGV